MDQNQIKDQIKLFLRGNLSPQKEEKLLEWIKKSTENKKYFHQLQQQLGHEMVNSGDQQVKTRWRTLLQRIDSGNKPGIAAQRWMKKMAPYTVPVAAAFIAGLFIASLIVWNISKPAGKAVEQKIATPYGARTQFMLPDSSLVWLNSGSELNFPTHFKDKRSLKLTGEAFFKVKKGKRPFIVSTVYGDVEVKGTSFNVKAFQDASFETTLVEGQVTVETKTGEKAILQPGYQAAIQNRKLHTQRVNVELYTSWTEGKLIFREEKLPELARRLERWYNVKIVIEEDPRLRKINYTGTIEMETFSEVLNLLSVTAPINYSWNAKTRRIKLFYKE